MFKTIYLKKNKSMYSNYFMTIRLTENIKKRYG